jgi:hypothetical protein
MCKLDKSCRWLLLLSQIMRERGGRRERERERGEERENKEKRERGKERGRERRMRERERELKINHLLLTSLESVQQV